MMIFCRSNAGNGDDTQKRRSARLELRSTKWIDPRLSTGMELIVRLLGRGNLYGKSVHDYNNVRLNGMEVPNTIY